MASPLSMSFAPTKSALKRLARDVRAVRNGALSEQGVYYAHDQTNVLKGHALVVGGDGTPYEDGCYEFEFSFPPDYPHRPPKVKFITGDGRTRMNPNLYRNGKVCLSVLNTWQGPQWTGCQTISSVLLSLRANVLAIEEPLLNEPGIERTHDDFKRYHDIVTFKNKEIAVWGAAVAIADKTTSLPEELRSPAAAHLLTRLPKLKASVFGLASTVVPGIVVTRLYSMEVAVDYGALAKKVSDRMPDVMDSLREASQIDV